MAISRNVKRHLSKSSWIRKMFEEGKKRKEQFGPDRVFDFSLGNPCLEPPSRFNEVVHTLIDDKTPGQHGYMPNAGIETVRQKVAAYLSSLYSVSFTANDIIMTVGAGGALNVVFKTFFDPDDEVIIPSPYFTEYDFYLDNHVARPVIVDTRSDFGLDPDAISNAVTGRTRAVLINSPNNPTGRVYTKKDLTELAQVLVYHSNRLGRPILLISDEPYRKIVYDGITPPGIFDIYQESIVVTSFSKDLSLAGERIGYAAVHPDITDKDEIMAGMIFSNRVLGYVNAPALMQRAVSYLLDETVDVSIYQHKRDLLYNHLVSFGYEIVKPQGAFYLFPKTPIDDVEFVSELRNENILTVPGSGFGGPMHFRIAYCVPDRTIEMSLPGFKRVLSRYA